MGNLVYKKRKGFACFVIPLPQRSDFEGFCVDYGLFLRQFGAPGPFPIAIFAALLPVKSAVRPLWSNQHIANFPTNHMMGCAMGPRECKDVA
jgi:hypothetical protein